MPAYFQMGYQSDNLISCAELSGYRGAILSPVDYKQADVREIIENCKAISEFETIFDPQLYFPQTERARLREWTYFPDDVDTADLTKLSW
ncbi:MAG TPA: hypothetical protein DDX29_02415 [Clostridiales bacterium]|nr:hypothetical protein [Clostridiales bacterium]